MIWVNAVGTRPKRKREKEAVERSLVCAAGMLSLAPCAVSLCISECPKPSENRFLFHENCGLAVCNALRLCLAAAIYRRQAWFNAFR